VHWANRMRVPLVLLAVLAFVATSPSPARGAVGEPEEREFVAAVNAERASVGLPALRVCTELRGVARRHSQRMAASSTLYHNPNLATEVSSWLRLAENVGRGRGVASIHAALMNSDGHRRNILDREVSQVGIGVETSGSTVWVTQVFRRPTSNATCSTVTNEVQSSTPPTPASEPTRVQGDFTGDGHTETATFDPATGAWKVARVTASGLSKERWAQFSTRTGWSHHLVGDFNGDGRDDLASYHPTSGTWWISRSTGNRFTVERWAQFSTRTGWSHHLVGDFNGDGRDDLASYHPTSGTWWISFASSIGSGFATKSYA
jgi:hypothetical protein